MPQLTDRIHRMIRLGLGASKPQDHRDHRSRSIIQGTITGIIAKGSGVIVALVSVPLTVRYLGAERYGVWITISTFLVFLSFTDFGLASSLTNALGKAYGQDEHKIAKSYISSAVCTLSLIAMAVLIIGVLFAPRLAVLLFPQADPNLAKTEIAPALITAIIIFALNFPLLISQRVLAGYQETALGNMWIIAGNIGNLAAILLVIWFRGSLSWLVFGYSGVGLLMNVACAVWVFGFRKPWLRPHFAGLDFGITKDLLASGWKFFVISTGWMINSQTDNLIIAHYLGASAVTPYAVTFRLFAYATILQTLVIPSLWPAYTEAYARKDFVWIRRTFQINLLISLLSTALIVTVLIAFGIPIIRLWAGPPAVPPFALLLWMGLWSIMLAMLYAFGCLLNAIGQLQTTMVASLITALINIFLSILFVRRFGISGVTAATVIAFLIAACIPIGAQIIRLFREFSMDEHADEAAFVRQP